MIPLMMAEPSTDAHNHHMTHARVVLLTTVVLASKLTGSAGLLTGFLPPTVGQLPISCRHSVVVRHTLHSAVYNHCCTANRCTIGQLVAAAIHNAVPIPTVQAANTVPAAPQHQQHPGSLPRLRHLSPTTWPAQGPARAPPPSYTRPAARALPCPTPA